MPVIAEMLNLTTELLNKTVKLNDSDVESAFHRGQKLYMLGVNYRHSPVVVDEFSEPGPMQAYGSLEPGVLIAGDRAPDASKLVKANTNGEETRFFDIFCPAYHTVLVFGSDEGYISSVLSALHPYDKTVVHSVVVNPASGTVPPTSGADQVVMDQEGHAHAVFHVSAGESRVVVVRPDGVVGAIVRGVEGVQKYFGKVFVPASA